jgi:hypothetical protein
MRETVASSLLEPSNCQPLVEDVATRPAVAVPPVAIPAAAGLRHVSPEQFRTKVELIDAIMRSHGGRHARAKEVEDEKVVLHATGELSTRGWRLQEEANAELLRQNFKQHKNAERLLQKKAHLMRSVTVNDDGSVAPPPVPPPATTDGAPPKRSRASLDRVNDLVFPPIISPRKMLHFPTSTARTAEPVPDHVAGLLEVTRPPTLAPNPPPQKRQPSTVR